MTDSKTKYKNASVEKMQNIFGQTVFMVIGIRSLVYSSGDEKRVRKSGNFDFGLRALKGERASVKRGVYLSYSSAKKRCITNLCPL